MKALKYADISSSSTEFIGNMIIGGELNLTKLIVSELQGNSPITYLSDEDNITRFVIQNINNGTNAVGGVKALNDAGNFIALYRTSSNYLLGEAGTIFNNKDDLAFAIGDFESRFVWAYFNLTDFTVETMMELKNGSNLNVTGNVTSPYFIGDGSQLTGISGGGIWTNVSGTATYEDNVNITGNLIIDSETSGESGLRFTQLSSDSTASSTMSGILGINTAGQVGLSTLSSDLVSPALAYWDGLNNPTTGSQASPEATLTGNAAYVSPTGVRLTQAVSGQSGSMVWDFIQLPYMRVQFQMKSGGGSGADAMWFFFGADGVPSTEYAGITNGYIIFFSEFHFHIGLNYGTFSDGNQKLSGGGANPLISVDVQGIGDNQWHDVDISVLSNRIIVRWDGRVIIDYLDVYTRDLADPANSNFGFGARTGGLNNEHWIKGLVITKMGINVADYQITNITAIQSDLYWDKNKLRLGIGTYSPVEKLDVNGSINIVDNVTASFYIGDGSLLTGISGGSLWTNSSGNATFTSGRVGIGTTTPQNTLNVIGDINFTGLIYGNGSQLTELTLTETDPLWTANSTDVAYLTRNNIFGAFDQTFDTNTLFIDSSNNRIGIGTTNPGNTRLDILQAPGNFSIVLGSNNFPGAPTRTDLSDKVSIIGSVHRTNAEEPQIVFVAGSSSVGNDLNIGGGSSIGNAATLIQFFTASDSTTLIGTPRFSIDNNGTAAFTENVTFAKDIIITGTIFGGSPVKISGGLNVTGNVSIDGELNLTKLDVSGGINVTSGNDVCIEGGNCLSSVGGGGNPFDQVLNTTDNVIFQRTTITNPTDDNALTIDQNGDAGASTSTGGALLIENTGNPGAGLIIYSNEDGAANGRLLNIRVDNSAFDQSALNIDYDGVSNAVTILNKGSGTSNLAFVVTSWNSNDTVIGATGNTTNRGIVKITHNQPSSSDANAAALSILLAGTSTAAQGIFLDTDTNQVTTGNLLTLRNNGTNKFIVDSDGSLTLGEKITFAFGEIIDNLVDGWITITGNLNVTGNIETPNNITGKNLISNENVYVGSGTEWLSIYLDGSTGYFNSTYPITFTNGDWQSYTPTISSESGSWTNVALTGFYKVFNGDMEVSFKVIFSGATSTVSAMYVSLPSGYTMNTAVMAGGGSWDTDPAGFAILGDTGTISGVPGIVNTRTNKTVLVKYTDDDDGGKIVGRLLSDTAPWTWANGDTVVGRFTVPVTVD